MIVGLWDGWNFHSSRHSAAMMKLSLAGFRKVVSKCGSSMNICGAEVMVFF